MIDPIRKQMLASSDGPLSALYDKCRRKASLESLDDEECEIRELKLARSGTLNRPSQSFKNFMTNEKPEYIVKISLPEVGLLWTLSYIEWGIGNHNLDLAKQHTVSMDQKYLYPLHDGQQGHLICRDNSRKYLNTKSPLTRVSKTHGFGRQSKHFHPTIR